MGEIAEKSKRVLSLDIFRGLNVALMIFVNELAGIGGLPWWTHHAKASVDAMTYVDMVFPGFLIIIGMSMPLALNARIRRGNRTTALIWYVGLRAAALLALGLILENGPLARANLMHGLTAPLWSLLAFLAAFLIWFDYTKTEDARQKRWHLLLRCTGVLLLVALLIVYRRIDIQTHSTAWLTFRYPEILGSIGYSYLVAGVCYLSTRKWKWAPVGWFLFFLTLNILSAAKLVNTAYAWWFWPIQNGSKPVLIFAGVLLASFFLLESRGSSLLRKIAPALALGGLAAISAWMLSPLGISKIRATPTWVLYNVAACCLLYSALYYLCDVLELTSWAAPVRSAGANTLLTYLLPDLWYYGLSAIGITWWSAHFHYGAAGVVRAFVFTVLMLALSTLVTRYRLRLQL